MNIVLAIAQGLVVMLVAPFFSGLARVIRAKMHNRRGPSILQDYRDLAKLMARPESVSSDSSFVLRIMPPLFLAVSFMLAMGLPMFTLESPMPVFGDAITIMYALALSRFFFALSGVDSSNAYAGFGGIRELLMSVLIEPSMLIALFTPGSNRAKYCPECAARMKRINAAKRKRKQREKCHALGAEKPL